MNSLRSKSALFTSLSFAALFGSAIKGLGIEFDDSLQRERKAKARFNLDTEIHKLRRAWHTWHKPAPVEWFGARVNRKFTHHPANRKYGHRVSQAERSAYAREMKADFPEMNRAQRRAFAKDLRV